ncbi:MAG TPA: YggT family protein [Holophagaceae bacterium]|nr:YggT family protein [Holophagaceae bacterium]
MPYVFLIAYYALTLAQVSIFIWAIMSWFQPDPRNPFVKLIHAIVDPFMRPIEALIPSVGGISFAGMIAFLLLSFIKGFFGRAAGIGLL